MTRVATLSIFSLTIALLILSGFSAPLLAQSGSIRLEGTVWDPSGDSLAAAALTAVDEKTGRQANAVSDSNGDYVFPALQPGVYTVTVKAKGFKDVIHRNLSLFSPTTVTEDFSFEVSAIEKDVTPTEIPRSKDSSTTASLPRKDIESLPTLNRDPLSLLVYQPGVQIRSDNPGYSTVNGTRSAMNGIEMDGLSITDPVQPHIDAAVVPVNPDIVSDIQIVTTGAKAEYGHSGGAQFVLASRPGTQKWSGDLYDYFRNKRLDANDFFNNASKVIRPSFTRNIFGGTISGPAFGKNTLLFANIEGNRTDQQVTRNRQVLTTEAKSGLFRWYTPGTTTLRSFDIVANDPRHLGIDPAVASLLAKLPAPNNTLIGDGLNIAGYKFNSPAYLNKQDVNVRLDHYAGSSHQLFFRFNYDRLDATDLSNNADAPYPGEKSGTQFGNSWGVMGGSNFVLSPRVVNELRVGYQRPETELRRPARLQTPMFSATSWSNPEDYSFPRSFKSPIFEASDYLSQSRRSHNFKYGVNFRRTVQSTTDYTGIYPTVTFGQDMGNVPSVSVGPTGVSVITNSDRQIFGNLYNDLLGRIESVNQTYYSNLTSVLPVGSPKKRDYLFQEFAGFVQDDWRILPNLTLNLGLRYEFSTVPKEQNGYQAVLDQLASVSPSANISNFKVVQGSDWYSKNLKDFAPRAGFAWDPFGTGSFVIRGAYGIYYDRLIGAITNYVDANSYGFSQNLSIYPNAAGTDLRLSDGIPVPSQPSSLVSQPPVTRASSIALLAPDIRTPRVDQFNLTLEKRLWGAVFEAGYVGTRGTRLFQYLDLNQTKTDGAFLQAFQELRAYRLSGTPVSASNSLVRMFGSPLAALDALGGYVIDSGQAGYAADTLDRNYYSKYAAAGISDFYIRNFPQFDRFLLGSSSSKSWYDALQLGIRKSTRNYNLRVNYAWSKSLDTLSAEGNTFVSAADSRNPESNKAPSDFDRRHVLNVAWNYALPFGRTKNLDSDTPKWVDFVFGGWNLGTLWVWESGPRFSISSGLQNRYAGLPSLANFDGNNDPGRLYNLYGTMYWFNADSMKLFTYPAAGEASTSTRNFFTGPRYFNVDCLLQKRFLIGEAKAVQFRLEAFNMLNQTHFSIPNTNLYDSNFGIISTTQGNPRRMQVALRFQF